MGRGHDARARRRRSVAPSPILPPLECRAPLCEADALRLQRAGVPAGTPGGGTGAAAEHGDAAAAGGQASRTGGRESRPCQPGTGRHSTGSRQRLTDRPRPGGPDDTDASAYHRGHGEPHQSDDPDFPDDPGQHAASRTRARLSRGDPVRDHRNGRSRWRAAAGRHLVSARRRRDRPQQQGRTTLALEPRAGSRGSRSPSTTRPMATAGSA